MGYSQNIDELKAAIETAEIVSFDIFDTLIKRIVNTPETIFDLVGEIYDFPDFREMRMQDQNLASQKVNRELKCPHANMNQIYQYISEKENVSFDWEKIKEAEIQMEYDAVVVNREIMELYQFAKQHGKRVIALSDMYLSRNDVEKMLSKCGYLDFDEIYISSEIKHTKYEGDIFYYVAEKERVYASQIFHIGDNYISDVKNAKKANWTAYLYEKDQIDMQHFGQDASAVVSGISNSLLYDKSEFWHSLGVTVGGPLYMGLFGWMKKKLKKYDYDKIFFMARDGYNLYQIFKAQTDEYTEYLYVSRRALLLAGIDRLDEDSLELLPPYTVGQTVREVLEYIDMVEVCGDNVQEVGIKSLEERITDSYMIERVKRLFVLNENSFLDKCREEREEVKKYFKNVGFLDSNSVVFDCGWNGSSQYLLDRFLRLVDYEGSNRFLYAGILDTAKSKKQLEGKKYEAYLFDQSLNLEIQRVFLRAIVIAELFFGAPEESTIKYHDGMPVLEKNASDQLFKEDICRGILDYVIRGITFVEKYQINSTVKHSISSLARLILDPTEQEAIMIGDLENVDGFVTQKDQQKYVAKLDFNTYRKNPQIEIYWLEGLLKRPDIEEQLKKELNMKYGKSQFGRQISEQKARYIRIKNALHKYGIVTSAYLYFSRRHKKEETYDAWIKENEKDVGVIELRYEPLFSFVVPVYNVEENQLVACIESIKNQTYKNWELCLIDDCSTWETVRRVLKRYETNDKIHIIYRSENGHISKTTNDGIDIATGEYIAFCDCDDVIAPNALYEFACKLNEHPEYDFVYSDEDKLTEDGKRRHSPFFKPDWSPDTFMSIMYTNHLAVYRKSLVLKTGGLRSEFNGAQDYDFTLRFLELTTNERVGHIPKVLYHWRERRESIASDMKSKPYALDAVKYAKEQALVRRHLKGKVQFVEDMYQYRVVYENERQPMVSIIIPSKDNIVMLFQCIDSIIEITDYPNYEIVLVDNGSNAENKKTIQEFIYEKNVTYCYKPQPFNFSVMCNEGARNAQGEFLLFLNNDIKILHSNWLSIMVGHASLDYIGAVGAKLLYPDSDIIQHIGVHNLEIGPSHALMGFSDSTIYYFGRNRVEYNYLALTAACLMIDKRKFWEIGGFDETLSVAYNDVDLCFKLYEHGYYNVVRNDVTLFHYESVSRGSDDVDLAKKERQLQEKELLYKKHISLVCADPFYNINLTGSKINYEIDVAKPEVKRIVKVTHGNIGRNRSNIVMIDEAVIVGENIRISGWFFTKKPIMDNLSKVNILLRSDDKIFSIPTDKVYRPDVAEALKEKVFLTGFTCECRINELPKENYEIGICIRNGIFKQCTWTPKRMDLRNLSK